MRELYPRLLGLALRARRWDVGLNIDAEESERLDLSLDLLEALCREPGLRGWNGVGFVVQAYQKRAYPVLGWIIELARATNRRIMLRLVKGAYWDSEIKRAQVEGLEGFAVFTRKIHTDVSYVACAKLLLAAPDAVFPQFATHNALTVATIQAMAAGNFYAGQYEFQCLHGMGEPLYDQIVGGERGRRPCRVYAPVGSHETLLAYLVRRLLENGANTSFVNRIADPNVPVEALVEDPVAAANALDPVGAPHPRIALPRDLFAPGAGEFGGPRSQQRSASGRARRRARAGRRRSARRRAARSSIPPIGAISSAGSSTPTRPTSRRSAPLPRWPGRIGVSASLPSAPPFWRGPPRCSRRTRRVSPGSSVGKPARRCPMRSATCARRWISYAITARRSRAASTMRRIARSASSPASARGISRSRSSPVRSPPRSPPATQSSPNPPRKRR